VGQHGIAILMAPFSYLEMGFASRMQSRLRRLSSLEMTLEGILVVISSTKHIMIKFMLVYLFVLLSRLPTSLSLPLGATDEYADVIILGAGISGIAAAAELRTYGISNIIILEAQDQVGGRLKQQKLPFSGGLNVEGNCVYVVTEM
jgi:hypothetical protein